MCVPPTCRLHLSLQGPCARMHLAWAALCHRLLHLHAHLGLLEMRGLYVIFVSASPAAHVPMMQPCAMPDGLKTMPSAAADTSCGQRADALLNAGCRPGAEQVQRMLL